MFSELQRFMSSKHPFAPHYMYEPIQIGSKVVFEHQPTSEYAAKEFPLMYKGTFKIVDKNIPKLGNVNEVLKYAYLNRQQIEIDMLSLEAWIKQIKVPSITEQLDGDNIQWFIKPIDEPETVLLKLSLKNENIELGIADYLEMTLGDFNEIEKTFVINNNRQVNSPLVVEIILQFDNLQGTSEEGVVVNGKVNIVVRDEFQHKVDAQLALLNFIEGTKLGKDVVFTDLQKNRVFLVGKNYTADEEQSENIQQSLSLFKRLKKLEEFFNVAFDVPEEFDISDFEAIEVLEAVMNQTLTISKFEFLNTEVTEKEQLSSILDIFNKEPKGVKLTAVYKGIDIYLFGTHIHLSKLERSYNNLVVADIDKLKRKYELMDEGDTIKVRYNPGTSDEIEDKYYA
ncbi:hypothetical protein BCQ_4305 [Bacillus cereus Q1]|uniref:Uncharacterized protein n=2 Tax=Bacillus TaxID=1386 RepID=B9IZ92_BACCQ|nr:hypothetical protein BCQ_4305 [Bacillus cereus Q1]